MSSDTKPDPKPEPEPVDWLDWLENELPLPAEGEKAPKSALDSLLAEISKGKQEAADDDGA